MSHFSYDPAAALRHYAHATVIGPTAEADRRTSTADARIALCLARGVAMDDIDPASGYDLSRRAYDAARQSWIDVIEGRGLSEGYTRLRLDRAFDYWAKRRSGFTDGDDWAAAGLAAHRAYWDDEIGRHCNRAGCAEHAPSEVAT